jgi:hypothetical protein
MAVRERCCHERLLLFRPGTMNLETQRACSFDLGQTKGRIALIRHARSRQLLKFFAFELMMDDARRRRGVRASR